MPCFIVVGSCNFSFSFSGWVTQFCAKCKGWVMCFLITTLSFKYSVHPTFARFTKLKTLICFLSRNITLEKKRVTSPHTKYLYISFDCFISADNTFLVVSGGKCPCVERKPDKTEGGLFCRFFSEAFREM